MEIMSMPIFRLLTISSLTLWVSVTANAAELTLRRVLPVTVQQLSGDRNAAMAILSQDPALGYALAGGNKTVIITLSKIENVDTVCFLNNGVQGDVTIAVSNSKLAANSPHWQIVAHQELSGNAVKTKVGPNEAKYVKLTFNVTEAGRLADLGIYSAPSISLAQVESDGKTIAEGKDFAEGKDLGGGKEVPAEGPESPAEGPAPALPPPPPFTFVPEIVPASP